MWRRIFLTAHKPYVHTTKWEYEPICQFKLSVLLCILCKCNCRRRSSHCESATPGVRRSSQKCVYLITEKFPEEEGGQWPTSVTLFAEVTYLCSRIDQIQIGKRILVDNLRSFRRRRSKQGAALAASGVKIPANVKMSAYTGSSIIQSRSWYEDSVLTNTAIQRI